MNNSPLALLPRELRDQIYHHLFTTTYATTLRTPDIQHPVTKTCRALRHETLPLYLALTRFNAHLDDGPATPLARWLAAIGRQQCLWLREVNIWDMHMLNGSLYGPEATRRKLQEGPAKEDDDDGDEGNRCGSEEARGTYALQPLGIDVLHGSGSLALVLLSLRSLGLGLRRFCVVRANGSWTQTSHFAIRPSGRRGEECEAGMGTPLADVDDVVRQLDAGRRLVGLHEGRDLAGTRQPFVPSDEEFGLRVATDGRSRKDEM